MIAFTSGNAMRWRADGRFPNSRRCQTSVRSSVVAVGFRQGNAFWICSVFLLSSKQTFARSDRWKASPKQRRWASIRAESPLSIQKRFASLERQVLEQRPLRRNLELLGQVSIGCYRSHKFPMAQKLLRWTVCCREKSGGRLLTLECLLLGQERT
jgi:hypothetical protein